MKIGDVVKVDIEGEIMSCIVISDLIKNRRPSSDPPLYNINYLNTDYSGYIIRFAKKVWLLDCYKVLIGDQIVHVETQEMSE